MGVKITRADLADILVDVSCADGPGAEGDRQQVYQILRELDIGTAFKLQSNATQVKVGLEAGLHTIERLLRNPGTAQPYPPDLIFLETSLFPERTRLRDVIRDFVVICVGDAQDVDTDASWKPLARTYERLYPELHRSEKTIYYVRRFFLESIQMIMPWSECIGDDAVRPVGFPGADGKDVHDDDQLLSGWKRGPGTSRAWFRIKDLLPSGPIEERAEWSLTNPLHLQERVEEFHRAFHSGGLPGYSRSYLWCVPLVGGSTAEAPQNQPHLGGLGAVFAIAAYKDDSPVLSEHDIVRVGRSLSYVLKDAFAPFLYVTARRNLKEALKHARRSAVAAVIGRNMSHNIGSHVLANVTGAMLKGSPENGELLLRYLQHRMDFIAQISTSAPSWCVGMTCGELLLPFVQNRLLLDNIARFAKIGANEMEFAVALDSDPWDVWSQTKWRYGQHQDWRSLRIDVAHGSVGAHAFYSILENLIRNTARHGDAEWLARIRARDVSTDPVTGQAVQAKLRFSFHLENVTSDEAEWSSDYFRLEITDHVPTRRTTTALPGTSESQPHDTAKAIDEYLQTVIIDEQTGELTRQAWGMKEIRIGTSFLRLLDSSDDAPRIPPVARVRWADTVAGSLDAERHGCLQLTMYLPKVKVAMVIGRKPCEAAWDGENTISTLWRAAGFDGIDKMAALERRLDAGEVFRHAFLVLDGGDLVDAVDRLVSHRARLPMRILFTGSLSHGLSADEQEAFGRISEPLDLSGALQEPAEFERMLWTRWCERRCSDATVKFRWPDAPNYEWPAWFDVVRADTPSERFALYEPGACVFDHDGDGIASTSKEIASTRYHQFIKGGEGVAKLVVDSKGDLTILNQLREMAAGRVVILDERIFERAVDAVTPHEAGGKYLGDWTLQQIWRYRGVALLPYREAVADFAEFVKNFRASLPFDRVPVDGPACDFFVVHEGLVGEFGKYDKTAAQSWELLKQLARHVVIDTGRGTPATAIHQRLPWVEYSNLADYVIGRPGDKLGLWRLLNSLRASRSESERSAP